MRLVGYLKSNIRLHAQCNLPEDEHKIFETCRRQEELNYNINLESALCWLTLTLYNCITMRGTKNISYVPLARLCVNPIWSFIHNLPSHIIIVLKWGEMRWKWNVTLIGEKCVRNFGVKPGRWELKRKNYSYTT